MRELPVSYRIPRELMRYAVMVAVLTTAILGGALWATLVAAEILLVAVLVAAAAWIFILVQCRSIGTTVTKGGIVRNGFFGDQQIAWPDITELAIKDRSAGLRVYGFQVASRYIVTISIRDRQRKLLLFLDERAFGHDVHAFTTELTAIGALWEQHRQPDAAP
ncbi:hypothetical protein GCM10022251_77760 [Phytohabitans flavus]|uniref:PH domain-containing protein n=1 Tax=Phytohabitans flavus TaxID=1076124 RepID=A0A6F8XNL5_9ACTN|nr:hypothetical protein [Phytohabitans flavus]BCB75413.1 hypothetical protein Pflav_018230 [Phytohabitans flavus]